MGIDDLIKKIEISKEYFEKFKKGEIDQETFYNACEILINDEEKNADEIKEKINDYEEKIIEFKRELAQLIKKITNFEANYINIFEQKALKGKYKEKRTFEEQVREYDEMQKRLKEEKEN